MAALASFPPDYIAKILSRMPWSGLRCFWQAGLANEALGAAFSKHITAHTMDKAVKLEEDTFRQLLATHKFHPPRARPSSPRPSSARTSRQFRIARTSQGVGRVSTITATRSRAASYLRTVPPATPPERDARTPPRPALRARVAATPPSL